MKVPCFCRRQRPKGCVLKMLCLLLLFAILLLMRPLKGIAIYNASPTRINLMGREDLQMLMDFRLPHPPSTDTPQGSSQLSPEDRGPQPSHNPPGHQQAMPQPQQRQSNYHHHQHHHQQQQQQLPGAKQPTVREQEEEVKQQQKQQQQQRQPKQQQQQQQHEEQQQQQQQEQRQQQQQQQNQQQPKQHQQKQKQQQQQTQQQQQKQQQQQQEPQSQQQQQPPQKPQQPQQQSHGQQQSQQQPDQQRQPQQQPQQQSRPQKPQQQPSQPEQPQPEQQPRQQQQTPQRHQQQERKQQQDQQNQQQRRQQEQQQQQQKQKQQHKEQQQLQQQRKQQRQQQQQQRQQKSQPQQQHKEQQQLQQQQKQRQRQRQQQPPQRAKPRPQTKPGRLRKKPNVRKSQQRMESRLAQAQAYCSRRKKSPSTPKPLPKNCPLFSSHPPSQFCPLAKVGSTFWTRFYAVLKTSTSDTLKTPYDIPLSKVAFHRCEGNATRQKVNSVKAMFVREPFSRVFSAYVDKLVSPNPNFWIAWGIPSINLDNTTQDYPTRGQTVTFRQFFHCVTKHLRHVDNHIAPMTTLCDPCLQRYDVIGHMETFPDDLSYMMSLLDVSFQSDVHLSRETKLDAIFDSIQGPFSWMGRIKKCISTPEMGRRIWRKLQIRGLISSRIKYPLGLKDLTNLTTEQFYAIALDAYNNSTDKRELDQQKQVAFVEAFRTVPLQDLRDFVRLYGDDFEAFGYVKFPESVFKRDKTFRNTGSLDFNKEWVIGDGH